MTADPPEVGIRRATPAQVEVILFGVPGHSYGLFSKTSLDIGPWESGPTKTITNSFHISPATNATNAMRFYRAKAL